MKDFDFTYLSFGGGVQSTALLVMGCLGLQDVPKPDAVIFADTQCEPSWVYETVRLMTEWAARHGVPVYTVTAGSLAADIEARHNGTKSRFAAIPAFTLGKDGDPTMLHRQCSREYKVRPVEKKVRELLGYKPRQRVKHSVNCIIGFSCDEISRCGPSRTPWVSNAFPLIDARTYRHQCSPILNAAGVPVPKKSSCVFCPYHSTPFWMDLKHNHPAEWAAAVRMDRIVRDMSMSGVRGKVYLHRSLKPLEEVDVKDETMDLFDGNASECVGFCDT